MTTDILTGVEFRPLTIPASLESDDAADFIAMVELRNRINLEVSGHDDHRLTATELLPMFAPDEYERRFWWLILVDSRVVGRAGVDIPLEPGSRAAYPRVELLREAQGRGIGARALELLERTSLEEGRTVLQTWAEHPDGPGERLAPPTGFGSIPADRAARFLLRHGYSLEQVERASALDLGVSVEAIRTLLDEARAAASGYRLVSWELPTPPEFVDGYAWMLSRMNTDAPSGAMEWDEEVWDAQRLARHDQMILDGGRTMLVTAAQHVETGDLCAFTELVLPTDRTRAIHQEATLVLKEHRGHSLGMLVKCANLLALRDQAPDSPRVITYNAEENRPMLKINEAMGFVPIAYEGAWKKVVDLPAG